MIWTASFGTSPPSVTTSCSNRASPAGWRASTPTELWLTAPLDVRADRIATREGKPVDRQRPTPASASEAKRYDAYYDIDITDLSIYDIALNTARWGPDSEPSVTIRAVESYSPDGDEGKAPVENIRYEF